MLKHQMILYLKTKVPYTIFFSCLISALKPDYFEFVLDRAYFEGNTFYQGAFHSQNSNSRPLIKRKIFSFTASHFFMVLTQSITYQKQLFVINQLAGVNVYYSKNKSFINFYLYDINNFHENLLYLQTCGNMQGHILRNLVLSLSY